MYAAAAGIQYELKSGEHLRVVAQYFGFGSLEPILQHPDNQALLSQRGGVDGLRGGDIVTIPEGTAGKKDLAPGRGHVLTVTRARPCPPRARFAGTRGDTAAHVQAHG